MPRFYVPKVEIEKGRLRIEGAEVRHIRRVLRLKEGDEIIVFDGSGKEYEGEIVEKGTACVTVMIRDIRLSRNESPAEIVLAQSLLKGEKMDYLIQKATELGIAGIIPFFSSRSVPLLDKSGRLKRNHRWDKIAAEASKQCGRAVVPKIESIQDYPEVLRLPSPGSLRLLLSERKGLRLKAVLEASKEKRKVFFIVGPEGGLSTPEVELAERSGAVAVNLGQRILRSETASLCFLSILQYELGDIG